MASFLDGGFFFAVLLIVAIPFSYLARRSVLSTSVLFLIAGFVVGRGIWGKMVLEPTSPLVVHLVEIALFAILYSEGMRVSFAELLRAWRLPTVALPIGLPLTFILTGVLARWLVGFGLVGALLLGAVLSPTDPAFASALVGQERVPYRLRHLLNVESGLNDGLALPLVLILLEIASPHGLHVSRALLDVALGVVVGIAVPWLILRLERSLFAELGSTYQTLQAFAIGLLLYELAPILHANIFLAAFTAGVTVTSVAPRVREHFEPSGEAIAEVLKLAVVMVFGSLLTPHTFATAGWAGYLFAVLALLAVRPLALGTFLLFSPFNWREWTAAVWFGPKGFSSVFYAILVLQSAVPHARDIAHMAAVVIVVSIIAHSSTDVVVARWFERDTRQG